MCCSVVWALALYSLLNIMKRSSTAFSITKSPRVKSILKMEKEPS